jgi:hypothetical protein
MEKPHINFSVHRVLSLLRAIVGGTMNAGVLWRVMIGSVFCAVIATCVFSYLTYTWAANTELPKTITKRDRNAFSLTDLKKVITLYQAKEERYHDLLNTRPIAPPYAKGKGVVVDAPSEVLKENVGAVASSTSPLMP